MKSNVLMATVFVVVLAVSRIPGLLPANFSAVYAFVFCAGVFLRGPVGWWLPLATLLVTDLALNLHYDSPATPVWTAPNLENLAFNYAAYALLLLLGRRFKPQASFLGLLGGGLLGAILFYLITNTASWFFNPFNNPEYAKTLAGWILALTKGVGGYPSTWEFFRNTLLSGGLFTALFAAAAKFTAESPADKTAGAREPVQDGEAGAEGETEGKTGEAGA